MKIAVASGKGGTGKTTVSASLISVWKGPVIGVDLDVEEPNLHLFLNPETTERETVYMEVPEIDTSLCTYCGACAALCQFKAISVLNSVVLTFPEMCHGCGGCEAVCPEGAVSAGRRELGEVSGGRAGRAGFIMGRLRVGEAMSPPLMRIVLTRLQDLIAQRAADAIIDAPPGVSCPAVSAVMDSDAIVLVTEPTPFGLYDMGLAVEAFRPMGKPMGVVINRAGLGDEKIYEFCREKNLPILAEIPFDRSIAEAYSRGEIIAGSTDRLSKLFRDLADRVRAMVPETVREKEVDRA